MGHWEWQAGEFKLPTAGFTAARAAVAEADKQHKERIFAETQRFWSGLTPKQKRDPKEYDTAAQTFANRVDGVDYQDMRRALDVGAKPRRVLKSDMDYPTNRSLTFGGPTFGITFDRESSSVTFRVDSDRHTVEAADAHPVMRALKKQVREMRWTRGTGGRIWGDNEYADDARQEHGYDSELTQDAYGPIGAANWPLQTRQWRDPKGDTYHVELKAGKLGFQGRVKKGAPASTGGQFASRYRPDSDVSLRW